MDLLYIFPYHHIGRLYVQIFSDLRGHNFLSDRSIKLKKIVKVRTDILYLGFKENFSPSLNFLCAKKKKLEKKSFFFSKKFHVMSEKSEKVGKNGQIRNRHIAYVHLG